MSAQECSVTIESLYHFRKPNRLMDVTTFVDHLLVELAIRNPCSWEYQLYANELFDIACNLKSDQRLIWLAGPDGTRSVQILTPQGWK